MASLDELMNQIPISDVAARLGVDEQTARAAVEQALPALVSGLEANAKDPGGAASLEKAVARHSPALVDGGVNLDEVDTDDGDKIVSHIFGPNREQVVATLGAQPAPAVGGLGSVVGKLLPILAPIVLSYLSKQFLQHKQSTETVQPTEPMQPKASKPAEPEQDGLGGLLGGLLGGGSSSASSGSSGGGIGDILGGILGGGSGGGKGGGGIGDLLGGLLGGGRK